MALPGGFENSSDYFRDCLVFFKKYQHLFKYPNTDLLVENILDQIKVDCLNHINVFADDFVLNSISSDYLIDFYNKLNKLKARYDEFENKGLEFFIDVPLSNKKKHEIAYLAKEIEILCKDSNCDTIIDFGSGLGYLDQQIFKTTGYNVLGIECNESHYVGAEKRQRKYHSDSIEHVKYVKHTVSGKSIVNIDEFIDEKFVNCDHFCIAGLHACADLTIDAINIFLKMTKASALIIMPCCYHRIIQETSCKFTNFPLSNALKNIHEEYNSDDFFTVPFLRLATQPPNACKENMEDLVFNLLARAVLQVHSSEHNYVLKRNKRKAVRLKSVGNNFEEYVQDAIIGYRLLTNNGENSKTTTLNTDQLCKIWREITPLMFKKAAIFILLQNDLQAVCENFILYDRLCYLQEQGIKKCQFKKIVNENISPRCLALLAQK